MIIDKKYKNFILFLIVIGLLFSLCRDSILNTLKNLYNKLSNCNENFKEVLLLWLIKVIIIISRRGQVRI